MASSGTATIEIRTVSGFEELERWVAVRNEVLPDDPESPVMMALIRASEFEHVDLLAVERDEIVGTGMLAGDPNSLVSTHPYIEVTVPRRHRGRGVGSALMRELSSLARSLGKEGVQCEARAHDPYSIGYLERRGFIETGRLEQLVLGLGRVGPAVPTPPPDVGIEWLAARPDLVEGMYAVAVRTYSELDDHIAKHAGSLRDWQLYELGDPRLLLELAPIAVVGPDVIGFALALALPDGETAIHRMTTVLPDRREQITAALVGALIAAARTSGLRRLVVWARTEELRRLHIDLGYAPRTATIAFRGPLL